MNTVQEFIDSKQINSNIEINEFGSQLRFRSPLVAMKFLCKQRILVVDDDPLNLFAISHNLKMAVRDMGHDQTIIDLVLDTASFGE